MKHLSFKNINDEHTRVSTNLINSRVRSDKIVVYTYQTEKNDLPNISDISLFAAAR